MNDAIIIASLFLGMASVLAIPLTVLLGIPTIAWIARGWLRLKERELELRRLDLALRIREHEQLPTWVDAANPDALIAWMRADAEVRRAALPQH